MLGNTFGAKGEVRSEAKKDKLPLSLSASSPVPTARLTVSENCGIFIAGSLVWEGVRWTQERGQRQERIRHPAREGNIRSGKGAAAGETKIKIQVIYCNSSNCNR